MLKNLLKYLKKINFYYKPLKIKVYKAYIITKFKSEFYKYFIRLNRFFINLIYTDVIKQFSFSRDNYK